MFLIEFSKGNFINGDDINYVSIDENSIRFTLKGELREGTCKVDPEFKASFVNNLQAFNQNISNVEDCYHKVLVVEQ